MRYDGKTTRQIAEEIEISKLSVVKKPAHEGALAKIIKSAGDDPAKKPNTGELNMDQKELEKMINDAVAPLQDKLAKADAMANMTDFEKAHYFTLEADKKDEFMKMSAEKRKEVLDKIEKAKKEKLDKSAGDKNDETFERNGKTIKKSAVGEDVFFILKAQQEENEKTRLELRKEKDARELQEFAKQADGLYPSLPGEAIKKAKVLKAFSGLGKEERETLETMLKAGDEAIKLSKAFEEVGYTAEDGSFDESPLTKLNKMAEDISKKDGVDFHTAYSKAIETPEGKKLYDASQKRR